MPWLCALLGGISFAQGFDTHHPLVPSSGIASEGGPGALWVNPANMSYDPDPRFGLFFSQQPDDEGYGSLAATLGTGGLGLGVHNVLRPDPASDDLLSDWSLDYGTSLQLPERISLGLLVSWNFIDTGTNYVGYDAGLSWRPLPWLGFGGSAQNIGSPDPSGIATPRSGAGIALRPFGSAVLLGLDYVRLFHPDPTAPATDADLGVVSVRLRPLEGLYLRGSVEGRYDEDAGTVQLARAGAGIEVYLAGGGGGYHADGDPDLAATHTFLVGTDEPGESLLRSGRRVPTVALDDAPPYQPRGGFLFEEQPSWLEILERIRRVEDDPGVRGLVLTLDGTQLSLARYKELRDRIVALEERDKPCVVYLYGAPSTGAYYVASAASRVAMHPAGDLELIGLSVQLTQLRGLLDLVGVEPQFVRRSEYKSAPEQFTRVTPSPAALEQQNALLDDVYDELVGRIAEAREVEAPTVRGWIDGGPWSAKDALERGIVDVLLYPHEVDDELERLHGGSVLQSDLVEQPQARSAWEDPQQIAVIYVEGAITPGESSRGGLLSSASTGADTVVRQLERARTDPRVRAVVMRVDSPGGSAFASDTIWRQVKRVRDADKPVVVSMGGVAASGGYYVSAGADAIWAEPNTITGSIGVFSGKFAAGGLLEDLGVTTTIVARGRNADIRSNVRPWDEVQRARMQDLVDQTYARFKDRVADGRSMTPDEVEEVARGRVWSGEAAKEVGLVDALGGLEDAIADARQRAGVAPSAKVGLVTYAWGGGAFESLAPSIATSVLGPIPRWIAASPRPPTPSIVDDLDAMLDPVDPLLVPLTHPEERLWLLDPWWLDLEGR